MSSSLDPFVPSAQKPWDSRRVQHLYRRIGFGASHAQIQQALTMSPSALVDSLVDSVVNASPPSPPSWANSTNNDYNNTVELLYRWIANTLRDPVRTRLSLFWHNHFVTELRVYNCNRYWWDYWRLLHVHAAGNFRTFVEDMGKSPAMLVYLNGNLNEANNPNENYARELLELFTMGESNGYVQADIPGVAKALTGWQVDLGSCGMPFFNAAKFNNSNKTIFGNTANYNYDSLHQLIFTQKADNIAAYVCGKLYSAFVYNTQNETIVNGLAETFKSNNFQLAPVLKRLFKSEHFFEDDFVNAQIISPIECFVHMFAKLGVNYDSELASTDVTNKILNGCMNSGQELGNPPNVAGWEIHRQWLNENTITKRWEWSKIINALFLGNSAIKNRFISLSNNLTGNSNNPDVIVPALLSFFLNTTIESSHIQSAIAEFKAGIPDNYFLDGSWTWYHQSSTEQIKSLMNYIISLPEWQLS